MTAEAAMVVPALLLLGAVLLWGIAAVGAQIRCVDAARAGARAAARSETPGDVLRVARAAAPSGAAVRVSRQSDMVRVRVTVARPRFPVTVAAEADALDEATLDAAVPDAAPEPAQTAGELASSAALLGRGTPRIGPVSVWVPAWRAVRGTPAAGPLIRLAAQPPPRTGGWP